MLKGIEMSVNTVRSNETLLRLLTAISSILLNSIEGHCPMIKRLQSNERMCKLKILTEGVGAGEVQNLKGEFFQVRTIL